MNAPEAGLYRPLVLSLAVFLVASGALLSIQMISAIVGPFRVADIAARDPRAVVALWRPRGSSAGEMLRGALGHALVESGRSAREVTALTGLDPARVGTIVLAEPRALTARDLAALAAYLEAGGGAVLLGSVAVHGPDGSWRGYELMERLLGAQIVAVDETGAAAFRADSRGPISAALDPRESIRVAVEPGTPGVLADHAELRWMGAPGPAAAIRRTRGKGRFAWLAVTPERAIPGEPERRRARCVLAAAIAWVSRTPSVEILPWPRAAAFATVVGTDESGSGESATPASWRREIDQARRDSGLAELLLPRESTAQLAPALGKLLDEAKRSGWAASRQELSSWTRSRAVVDASVRRAGPRRLVVEVTNRGADLEGLAVRVYLNEPALEARVRGTKLMQSEAVARLLPDGEALDMALPPLAARSSTAYSLDIEPAPLRASPGGEG